MSIILIDEKIIDKFWLKVNKTDSCWIWDGVKTPDEYGRFCYDGKRVYAHRFAYEITNDKIPFGLQIDHLCRNPSCVNPNHLEIVTSKINTLRGIGPASQNSKKTHCKEGHALKEPNLVSNKLKKGMRICKTCYNKYSKEYMQTYNLK